MDNKITFQTLIKNKDTEAYLYLFGILTGLALALLNYILIQLDPYIPFLHSDTCVFREILGIYCPGCGGTRAFFYFFQGQFGKSMLHNCAVTYALPVLILFYLSQTLRFVTHGRIKGLLYNNIYVIIFAILLAANFMIKNATIILFHIYLID